MIEWKGDRLKAKVADASKHGIDTVMALCVNHAKSNHPWHNVTGTAEGSIMMRPAVEIGHIVVGRWGSFDVNYFLFLEVGTGHMSAMPSLRPAADTHYRMLATLIKEAMKL